MWIDYLLNKFILLMNRQFTQLKTIRPLSEWMNRPFSRIDDSYEWMNWYLEEYDPRQTVWMDELTFIDELTNYLKKCITLVILLKLKGITN